MSIALHSLAKIPVFEIPVNESLYPKKHSIPFYQNQKAVNDDVIHPKEWHHLNLNPTEIFHKQMY